MAGSTVRRLALALALAALASGCDRLVEAQIERNLGRVDAALLRSPDLHVVLCGTGSPLPDAERAAACTAVVAGGRLFLVDVGPGAWERVDLANLPPAALDGVLLTHFHSDHIGDLGEAITQSWIAGRTRPLAVYGPPGTARIVAGLAEAYAADVEARVAHHGDANMPRAAAGALAREFALPPADEAAVVLDDGGLRITAFHVDHRPVVPAVGYRFDFAGRSVVVSGDARRSPSVVRHARGADLLIHEALCPALIQRAIAVARRRGQERVAALAEDVLDYHTSAVDAAAVASEAGAARLVLTHLVPGPPNALARRIFLAGVSDAFDGDVVLGEDGMRFDLPAR
jgi:ribonuclease Z